MKLARQIFHLSWTAAVVVTAVLGTTVVTIDRVHEQTRQIETAQLTCHRITHLRYLLIAASSYPGQADSSQGRTQIAQLQDELARHRYSDVEENILLERERENAEVIGNLFTRLFAINQRYGKAPPAGSADAALWAATVSGLNVTTQEMSDDGFELMHLNRRALHRAQSIAVGFVLFNVLALALLVALSVLIIRRRVLVPVASLQAMTAAVARGRLDRRLQMGDDNELGELAATFDGMTESLQRASQAKQDEIGQRQQAQASLERSVAQLADKSAELVRARADLQNIIDHTPALVVYWDAELRNRFANRAFEDWFGLTPAQLDGKHMCEVIGAEPFAAIEGAIASVLQGNSEMFERHLVLPDGTERDALFAHIPDVQDGKVRGFYGFVSDVTKLRRAQAAESEAQALVRSVVDAARDFAIIATGLDGTISLFSSGAERLLGYPASAVVGVTTPALFHLDEEIARRGAELTESTGLPVAGFSVFVTRALAGESESRDWTYRRADGSLVPVNLTVTAVPGADGAPVGYLGVAKDIGKEKDILAALAEARDVAEAASETKSRFLANMSHEIRTPMHGLLGMLQLLSNMDLPPLHRDYVAKTMGAATSLLDLLNDILDISKIEAGKLSMEVAPFALEALAGNLAVMAAPLVRERDIELLFELDCTLPARVQGDMHRLRQVLLNLLSNAIKFTERGEVRLHIRRTASDRAMLEFSIADTGIGIEPGQLAGIFDAFSQAEASTARKFGGTGLGLAISRELIAMMDGQFEVASQPGQGSCFTFRIALAAADEGVIAPQALCARRAVVIDDHQASREAMARNARLLGWDMQAVSTQAALAAAPGWLQRVEFLFVDAACLAGTARAALVLLAEQARKEGCKLVLMGLDQVRAQALAAEGALGHDGFLAKPVMRHTLLAATNALLPAAPATPAPASGGQLPGLRVLVVDDNALNRLIACELLRYEGCAVEEVDSGDAAIARLCTELQHDVVLMDVQMPGKDGFDTTRALRAYPHLAHLPIIAMTANAMPGDRERCLAAGMCDYEEKPINIDRLVATILRNLYGRLEPGCSMQASPSAGQGGAALPAGPHPDGLADARAALERMAGNTDLFGRLASRFEADAGVLVERILASLARGDDGQAASSAHGLCGIAGTVGATALAAHAAMLETTLRRPDPARARETIGTALLAQLAASTAQLHSAVAALVPAAARARQDKDTGASSAELIDRLEQLLESANMEALEVFAVLERRLNATAAPTLPVLALCIERLDFAAALACFPALRKEALWNH